MKNRVKTDSITLRVDPRFRFALELLSRKTGATMTSLIERAIVAQAAMSRIGGLDWAELWHPEEAVRSLRVASMPELMPSHEEERRSHFCGTWHPFFYRSGVGSEIHEPRVVVLWPAIDRFIDDFERTRSSDFFAVAETMIEALHHAGLDAPKVADLREAIR